MGKTWHLEHFICGGPCKQQLSGKTFFERNGKPYCTADYERLYAPKCGGCKKPIAEKALSALESKWHKECFKCKVSCPMICTTPSLNILPDSGECECFGFQAPDRFAADLFGWLCVIKFYS